MEFPIYRYAGNLGTNRLISRVTSWVRDGQAHRVYNRVQDMEFPPKMPSAAPRAHGPGWPQKKKWGVDTSLHKPPGAPMSGTHLAPFQPLPEWNPPSGVHPLIPKQVWKASRPPNLFLPCSSSLPSDRPPARHSKAMEGLQSRSTGWTPSGSIPRAPSGRSPR